MAKLKLFADTDRGRVYQHNEDSVLAYISPDSKNEVMGLIIVADGIGGHQAGEIASNLVIDTIFKNLKPSLVHADGIKTEPLDEESDKSTLNNSAFTLANHVKRAIEAANTAVFSYSQRHPFDAGNLGSTVTCALIKGNQVVIGNVGDSRAYHFKEDEFVRVTKDHSYVESLIDYGMADTDAYYTHPHRSVITRAIGNQADVESDIFFLQLEIGDRLLLCTDGCWEYIADDSSIEYILKSAKSLEEAGKDLIKAANIGGGGDNIGVALAEYY